MILLSSGLVRIHRRRNVRNLVVGSRGSRLQRTFTSGVPFHPNGLEVDRFARLLDQQLLLTRCSRRSAQSIPRLRLLPSWERIPQFQLPRQRVLRFPTPTLAPRPSYPTAFAASFLRSSVLEFVAQQSLFFPHVCI